MRQLKSLDRTELLLIGGLALFVFCSAFFQVSDVDVGYHMRTAQHILAGNGIPTKNTFSYTAPNEPWLLHQWLGTIIFYAPYRLGGVGLLIAFKALVATGLMFLVWGAGRQLSGPCSIWPWVTITIGTLIARVRFFERSDLFSAFFCALVLFLDQRFDRNRRWQWLGLPLLMALWANIHAGVIYGVALLCAISAGEWFSWLWHFVRRPASEIEPEVISNQKSFGELCVRPLGILLSVLAALMTVQIINPIGARVLWFPISQFRSPFWRSAILEYQAPAWSSNRLFYVTLGAAVLLQLIGWRRVRPKLLFPSLLFGYLACTSQRSMLFFVIAAMPHLALLLKEATASVDFRSTRPRLALPIAWLAIVLLMFLQNPVFVFGAGFYHPYYPLEVYNFVRAEVPPQNLFNEMRYGGSMLWWLYPQFKPFIDGRGDAFSEAFWKTEYLPVISSRPGSQEILKKYNVTGALLPVYEDQTLPPLAKTLHADKDWALVAFNDNTLLFLRRTTANQEVIARHEFRLIWPGDSSLAALDAPDTRAQATAEAKRAFDFSSDSPFARTALARAYFVNEQFAPAALILRTFASQKDAGVNYLRDFGYSLFRLGQYREADHVFARMVRKKLLPGFAGYMRHFIALEEGRPRDAREFLAKAVEAEPGNAEYRAALNRLGHRPSVE
jgi:hypothetical protein